MAVQSRVGELTARLEGLVGAGPAARPEAATALPLTFACLVLTCALLPAYTVRWHLGPLPSTLLEVSILLSVAALAFESWRARELPPWRSALLVPAVLFVVAGAVAVLVSPDHRAGLGLYRAYILEPIALCVVVAACVRDEPRARLAVLAMWLGAAVAGLANLFVILDAVRHHTLNVAVAPPVAIYQTPNAVALFLLPLIALAGALALHAEDRRLRVLAGVFGAVGVAATIASFSRGGYLALFVIALLLALTHRRRLLLVPALLAAALLASRLPPVAMRLGHEVDVNDPNNSLVARFRLWGATLRMLRDHPVLGSGLSGFARSIDPHRNGEYTEQLIYPHNILLNFWTETGLLGVAAFAWILGAAGQLAWQGWRRGAPAWRPYHLGVGLALVGIVVHGLVDVPYWKNDLSAEFWILLGLTWAGSLWGRRAA